MRASILSLRRERGSRCVRHIGGSCWWSYRTWESRTCRGPVGGSVSSVEARSTPRWRAGLTGLPDVLAAPLRGRDLVLCHGPPVCGNVEK